MYRNSVSFDVKKSALFWTQDEYVVAPYAFNGGKWLGFDDEESVRIKSQYILDEGYGGGMVWSIDTDDFQGFCTGKKFGLIGNVILYYNLVQVLYTRWL